MSSAGISAQAAASWGAWDDSRKRAHGASCLGWVFAIVALSTTWASYTHTTGVIPALVVSEIDLSLLTGVICGNGGGCQDASTQVTDSPIWISVSDATGHACGASAATLFRTLFALTLIPVVLLAFFESARWVSVFQLPFLPFDISYSTIEALEWQMRCLNAVLSLVACIYGAVGLFSNSPVDWSPYSSTAREGFIFAWMSFALFALGAVYTLMSSSYSGRTGCAMGGVSVKFHNAGPGGGGASSNSEPLLGGSTSQSTGGAMSYQGTV